MLKVSLTLEGHYTVRVIRQDGSIRLEKSGANTVTNYGIENFTNFRAPTGLVYGTNTDDTDVTKKTLNSQIGSTTQWVGSKSPQYEIRNNSDDPNKHAVAIKSRTIRIPASTTPYVLGEFGVFDNSAHNLMNRIVARDSENNRGISVGIDEFVDISFEILLNLPDKNVVWTGIVNTSGNKITEQISYTAVPVRLSDWTTFEVQNISNFYYSLFHDEHRGHVFTPFQNIWVTDATSLRPPEIKHLTIQGVGLSGTGVTKSIPSSGKVHYLIKQPLSTDRIINHQIEYIAHGGMWPIAFIFNPPIPPKTNADLMEFSYIIEVGRAGNGE